MESEGMLRHLAFFEELGRMDENDASWRSVSAGLVVMRLVDNWIEDGATPSRVDAWGVSAVREAIAEVAETTPLRRILNGIVDIVVSSNSLDLHALIPRLMAYGQALDYESKFSLAGDVYTAVIAHAHPVDDADLVVTAHIQLAFCLRTLGEHDAAREAYAQAARVATQAGDIIGVLRARLGDAKLAITRGNMPEAESMLDETIARAREVHAGAECSNALHARAHVAGLRGQFERSIEFAYQALELATGTRDRDRILSDIATSFMYLGLFDVARDAYLVLASTAQEQYIRWMSEINLMEIAAKEGTELRFDKYRRELSNADFTPQLRVVYLLHVGRGYHLLGQAEAGIEYLERAVELASRYSFNQLVFEAEQALGDARHEKTHPPVVAPMELLESVQTVIGAISGMKQLAGMA
jgi:tetratricopeptide (TPR) repeat protein